MSELNKSLAFVAVALVLAGSVWLTAAPVGTQAVFNDQGEAFFPAFKDPLACTSMAVIDYDPATATASPFKVEFKDGRWTIPSHHDYPADGEDRLAKTAAGVIDLRKDTIRSDRVEDQESMGVIDPLDAKSTSFQGRGKRVTLRNASDEVLADFIIGKEVPGKPDQRFVRVPGQKRIYGVNVKVDLSTRFSDWIETNLLKVEPSRVRRLTFDNHKVQPERRRLIPGEVLTVARPDSSSTSWTLEGTDLEAGKELDTGKLSTLTSSLSDLKIVGVRPKPAGLSEDLKVGGAEEIRPSDLSILSLADRGFYLTQDGLYSNEGDLKIATDEGSVYTLRFGEVTFARGEDLSAGLTDEEAAKKKQAAQAKQGASAADEPESEGGIESRYLFVTVDFDPTLIPEPKAPEPPANTLPDDVFARDPDDPIRVAEAKKEQEAADVRRAAHEKTLEEARATTRELAGRFAAWYYLIPGDAYRKLMLDRAALARDEGSAAEPPATPGGFPGGMMPGGAMPFGLPPGH